MAVRLTNNTVAEELRRAGPKRLEGWPRIKGSQPLWDGAETNSRLVAAPTRPRKSVRPESLTRTSSYLNGLRHSRVRGHVTAQVSWSQHRGRRSLGDRQHEKAVLPNT